MRVKIGGDDKNSRQQNGGGTAGGARGISAWHLGSAGVSGAGIGDFLCLVYVRHIIIGIAIDIITNI